MPIKHTNAPVPSFEELLAHVDNVHSDPNDHSPHIPHKVYTMYLDDLVAGKRYDAAQLVGWRFVFRGDDGHHHVADIGIDEATGDHTFHHINMGRHVNNFIAVYDNIHDHETVTEKDYEINLLRVPACYVMAVWFQGTDHDHEFLVPLSPVHENFEPNRHYDADEFMAQLEDAARRAIANALPEEEVIPNLEAETETQRQPDSDRDDLTRLLGIDARTAAILNEMGLIRFADVAQADPGLLMEILAEAGSEYRFDDPEILIEQARLAAEGDWRKMQGLQKMLRRRYGLDD
jgi:predicted flap endonuclease-1-like 5' DNA nuclease